VQLLYGPPLDRRTVAESVRAKTERYNISFIPVLETRGELQISQHVDNREEHKEYQ